MSFTPKKAKEAEKARKSYRLDKWQERALLGMFGMVTLSFVMSNAWAVWWQNSDWLVAAVLPAVVVDLTNEERTAVSATPLTRNTQLDEAARQKAHHMAENNYFAHYSPDGVSPWYWFDKVGYEYQYAGENLAVHFTDSEAVVKAWLNSPSHKENIINSAFTEIGVGTARGEYQGYDTVFVVQMFGTPRNVEAGEVASESDLLEEVASSDTPEENLAEVEESVVVAGASTSLLAQGETEGEAVEHEYFATATTTVAEANATTSTTSQEEVEHNTEEESPAQTSLLGRIATQPNMVLGWVYGGLSVLVIGMTLWALRLEVHRRRKLQIAYSIGLLLLMGLLWYVHTLVTGTAVIG